MPRCHTIRLWDRRRQQATYILSVNKVVRTCFIRTYASSRTQTPVSVPPRNGTLCIPGGSDFSSSNTSSPVCRARDLRFAFKTWELEAHVVDQQYFSGFSCAEGKQKCLRFLGMSTMVSYAGCNLFLRLLSRTPRGAYTVVCRFRGTALHMPVIEFEPPFLRPKQARHE